jgi:hypothetical protein
MTRPLFSVALIGFAAVVLGGIETGDGIPPPPEHEWSRRTSALMRARVFLDEPFDASAVDFAADPNRTAVDAALTACRYAPDEATGTTPKFDCMLADGQKIKVKYGSTREIPSEIAATRLLRALGFGADRVSRVAKVRCHGCPFQPFHSRALIEMFGLANYFDARIDYTRYRDFTDVGVERNIDGEAIEAGHERGWAFYELDTIDPARGGATRAEVDALRLMAVFLHHWDNKSANQRLICVDAAAANCRHPLAMIQDAGSEFGPKKVVLSNWRARPVWPRESKTCVVSMNGMPYDGGTFENIEISEGGRRLLGERLRQLSVPQIETLFTTAGFEDVPQWTAVFQDKVRQIVSRAPCPTVSDAGS